MDGCSEVALEELLIKGGSYAANMRVMRDELHLLVDQLPEDRVLPVLVFVRDNVMSSRRSERAMVVLERTRDRMRGMAGVDEELEQIREVSRG